MMTSRIEVACDILSSASWLMASFVVRWCAAVGMASAMAASMSREHIALFVCALKF